MKDATQDLNYGPCSSPLPTSTAERTTGFRWAVHKESRQCKWEVEGPCNKLWSARSRLYRGRLLQLKIILQHVRDFVLVSNNFPEELRTFASLQNQI